MKKAILFLATLFLFQLAANAQTKKESLKELFRLMQTDSMVDKMFSSMLPMIQKQMSSINTKEVDSEKMNEMMGNFMLTVKEISKRMINEDMVDLYDKYFTQAEVDDFQLKLRGLLTPEQREKLDRLQPPRGKIRPAT